MSIDVSARESLSAESSCAPAADEVDAVGLLTAARAEMGVPFRREERCADEAGDDANDGGRADRWVDVVGDAGRRDADGVVLPPDVEVACFLGVVEAMGHKRHSIGKFGIKGAE
jgi:hypothetical protein